MAKERADRNKIIDQGTSDKSKEKLRLVFFCLKIEESPIAGYSVQSELSKD
jgi:hypothetical protein